MGRKRLKLILLTAGIATIAAGLTMFIADISGFSSQRPRGFGELINDVILPFYLFSLAGITALSVVSFMHSKDIRDTKRNLSVFLKTFACFWIAGGALSAAALILIFIFFN